MRTVFVSVLSGCLILAAAAAGAVPVKFTFQTTIGSSGITGVSPGDTVTLEVLADNGGASLLSQTFVDTDVISAVATAGSYSATYNFPFFSTTVFETDGAGLVSLANFFDIDANNEDIVGSGGLVAFGSDSIRDFSGNLGRFDGCLVPPGLGPNCSDDITLWTVGFATDVPAPPALILLGVPVIALILRRRPFAARG